MIDARHKPMTEAEYLEIKADIYQRLKMLSGGGETASIPEVYEFSVSNYPNPFNPETTIFFTMPSQSDVSINVYNIKGQRVQTLINEILPSGKHEVIWNG